jgi:predicted secreted protein
MTWFTGIVVYIILWWTVLFMVLPWGVKIPENPEPGHATSAPTNPRLCLKMLITTAIATVLWLVVYWVIESEIISFRPQ